MKNFLLSILIIPSLFLLSCGGEENPPVNEELTTKISENDIQKEETLVAFNELYQELIILKDEEEFHKYGFKKDYPYENWMNRVKALSGKSDSILLIDKGILIRELKQLGIAYEILNGQESNFTDTYREIFDEAIK